MKREIGREIYESIDSIAGKFLSTDIPAELEKEFGDKARYRLEEDSSKSDNGLGGFELSYLISEEMAKRTGDIFYDRRAENFREFIDESRVHGFNYGKKHFMQYHNLYTNFAQDLDLEVDCPELRPFTPAGQVDEAASLLIDFLDEIDRAL